MHHDLGCIGAAVHRRALERQLQILMGAGVNAIRTAHNPPAPELLDLCDEMGILVVDEIFDEWKSAKTRGGYARFFDEWHEKDVTEIVRRDRNHTWIAGSSMGGLMSLYAVLEYNHVFSRAAALSPSIWFASKKMDDLIARSKVRPDTVIYMDYGQREMKFRDNMMGRFNRVSSQLIEKGVLLTSRIVPGGEHNEASWEKQIPFFINTLLYDGRR